MKLRIFFFGVSSLALGISLSCAAKKTFTIHSIEPGSQIALVPVDAPGAEGQALKNPASVEKDKLSNNAVRVSASGKASHFWFIPSDIGTELQVKITNLPSCEGLETNRNRPLRFLLQAYQALYSKEYDLVKELAGNAATIDSTLAAPHILMGLAFLREGNKAKAKVSFSKAKALDPDDAEIGILLRTTQ